MSEIEKNTQEQKPKISKLAVLSGILAFLSIVMISSVFFGVSLIGIFLLLPSILLTLFFSIFSLRSIRKSKGLLKGRFFSIAGIFVSLVLLVVVIYGAVKLKGTLDRIICGERLYGLRQCLINYSESNNGKYPPADNWCDLLVEKGCPQIYFTCPNEKNSPCSYAMNPNVSPNSPYDVVLLFESTSGWNQFGGPELIDANNHVKEGANVLFNVGYVEFVKPENFGKLNWGGDPNE